MTQMPLPIELLVVLGAWVLLVVVFRLVVVPRLSRGPAHEPVTGVMWLGVRGLSRFVHRTHYTGLQHLASNDRHGGLLIVSNHTGAVDPLLIQAPCRFLIRWMMAQDMMVPSLDLLWRQQRVISVDRDASDSIALRHAIRHIKDGGAIGIFPEGRIVSPPQQVWPFHPGVGLIAARTKVPVLLVWVTGTPQTQSTAESVLTSSNARVTFIDLIRFGDEKRPNVISEELRRIWNVRDLEGAQAELKHLLEKYTDGAPKLAGWLENSVPPRPQRLLRAQGPTAAVCAHRTPSSAIQQEFKRRTVEVRIFPNEASPTRLVSAIEVEIDEKSAATDQPYISRKANDDSSVGTQNSQTSGCVIFPICVP